MPERIRVPSSHFLNSWLLYVFQHRGTQRAVWLHEINGHGSGYIWKCSCGANSAGNASPLTTDLLHSAWSHFDAHLDPVAVPLHGPMARWYRGGQDQDLDALFRLEVSRIISRESELPVEFAHICGTCGESFAISGDDPHWATGKGPICPMDRQS